MNVFARNKWSNTHSVSHTHTHTPERGAQLSSVALSRFPPEIRKSSGGEKKMRQGFFSSLKALQLHKHKCLGEVLYHNTEVMETVYWLQGIWQQVATP